jgi:hypothetical protein
LELLGAADEVTNPRQRQSVFGRYILPEKAIELERQQVLTEPAGTTRRIKR